MEDVFGLVEYHTTDCNAWHCFVAIWHRIKVSSILVVVEDDLEHQLSSIADCELEGEWPVVDSIPPKIDFS